LVADDGEVLAVVGTAEVVPVVAGALLADELLEAAPTREPDTGTPVELSPVSFVPSGDRLNVSMKPFCHVTTYLPSFGSHDQMPLAGGIHLFPAKRTPLSADKVTSPPTNQFHWPMAPEQSPSANVGDCAIASASTPAIQQTDL
jgi:hypothetical protein